MKIYTSYFAKIKKLPPNITPVSISLYPPRGFKGAQNKNLSPNASILQEYKTNPDQEKYCMRFQKEVLDKLSPTAVYKQLEAIGMGDDVALCCFEKPEDFCHRHLVAKWLEDNLGIEVSEWE